MVNDGIDKINGWLAIHVHTKFTKSHSAATDVSHNSRSETMRYSPGEMRPFID
jgi:hypothetical protein